MKRSLSIGLLALGSCFFVACGGDDTSGTGPDDTGSVDDTGSGSDSTAPKDSGTDAKTDSTTTDSTVADSGTDTAKADSTAVDSTATDTKSDATDAADASDTRPDSVADSTADVVDVAVDAAFPTPPVLGAQIDRMGRPAIATALISSFNETGKGAAKDAYNANAVPSTWVTAYKDEMARNLAILDSLDANCGNQLFVSLTTGYVTLAGVLADDRLWLKSDATTCTQYLAVEANATGALANTDCGGRKTNYEVMKTTYSVVAIGAFSGVTDGVTPLAKSSVAAFPYLAAPP